MLKGKPPAIGIQLRKHVYLFRVSVSVPLPFLLGAQGSACGIFPPLHLILSLLRFQNRPGAGVSSAPCQGLLGNNGWIPDPSALLAGNAGSVSVRNRGGCVAEGDHHAAGHGGKQPREMPGGGRGVQRPRHLRGQERTHHHLRQ